MTRYSNIISISHVCLMPCVYCCVFMHVYVRTFLYYLLMFNTSQGVTANLPQLLVNDSHQLLMSEGLSKANHNTEILKENQVWLDYLWDLETREIDLDSSSIISSPGLDTD